MGCTCLWSITGILLIEFATTLQSLGRRKQCPLTGGNLNFCISGLAAIRV